MSWASCEWAGKKTGRSELLGSVIKGFAMKQNARNARRATKQNLVRQKGGNRYSDHATANQEIGSL